MARREYIKMCKIRCFANTDGKLKSAYGNSGWTPYRDGSPADVTFRAGMKYSVQIFENDDGSVGIDIAEIREREYTATDNISDNISQGGLKPIAETIENRVKPAVKDAEDDIDIPF
jgi:hypothetical protein